MIKNKIMYYCFVYNNGFCYQQRSFSKLFDAKAFMDGLCSSGLRGKIQDGKERIWKWYNK